MKNEGFYISISEPWDFEALNGKNIIKGNLLNIKSSKCLIFKSICNLVFEKTKHEIFILTPRYNDSFYDLGKKAITVNVGILLTEYTNELTEFDLINNSIFKFIGNIYND